VLRFLLIAALAWPAGCGHRAGGPDVAAPGDPPVSARPRRIDRTLSAAARYLLAQQAADGAWRSETYGAFKDGGSLTPLVLHALLASPPSPKLESACRKGTAYLASMARPDGTIDEGPYGLSYPVYTAALAVAVLSGPGHANHRPARDAWLAYLRRRQLTEDLGWQPADKAYGGWGFSPGLPQKPGPGAPLPPLTESNLSATVFALEALRAAGCAADDLAFTKALTFVRRCQNHADDPTRRDPAFDDGGFFFIYDDAVRNKAGVAGKDRAGNARFFSYGSTTADGLRCLLACGLPADDARVMAARGWLEKNFSAETHPGNYAEDRESARPSVYYYYSWSVARALSAAGVSEVATKTGKVRWAEALADALIKRQRPDGSWCNDAVAVREDDPVMATALAASALAVCRPSFGVHHVEPIAGP
jgi:squalene-hopene/tetraprenyl-beta-curcumene cyclase